MFNQNELFNLPAQNLLYHILARCVPSHTECFVFNIQFQTAGKYFNGCLKVQSMKMILFIWSNGAFVFLWFFVNFIPISIFHKLGYFKTIFDRFSANNYEIYNFSTDVQNLEACHYVYIIKYFGLKRLSFELLSVSDSLFSWPKASNIFYNISMLCTLISFNKVLRAYLWFMIKNIGHSIIMYFFGEKKNFVYSYIIEENSFIGV